MLLSFLEQELTQKINLYYYPFHFSLVCLLMFCSQKKPLFLDERISCLKTKKADQRGERLSDGRHQLGEGDESKCAADWGSHFCSIPCAQDKSRAHFLCICSSHKLSRVVVFSPPIKAGSSSTPHASVCAIEKASHKQTGMGWPSKGVGSTSASQTLILRLQLNIKLYSQ